VDNFTIIGKHVRIANSAIMDRTIIGDYAVIEDSIIGRYVEIRSSKSRPVRIVGSVIADDVVIEEGTELINSKIYPHKHINAEKQDLRHRPHLRDEGEVTILSPPHFL
jgi:Nucleoside-diphosphate-sugar pyrophosphorylase involved in lipopolysaccharide biosynthesis/translation initiation factor 2B, gamma/epsilon subunits (eIF-2Bgamma/eIF-2Bepsilon)